MASPGAAQQPVDEPTGLDGGEVRALIGRRWKVVLAVFVVAMIATIAVNALMAPVYEAEAAVAVLEAPGASSSIGAAASQLLGVQAPSPSLEAQEWMLTHPVLLGAVIERLDLQMSIKELSDRLTVQALGTSVVRISVEAKSPDRAALIANEIAEYHVERSTERAQQASRKTLASISNQLQEAEKRVERSQLDLQDFKTKHGIIDLSTEAQEALGFVSSLAEKAAVAEADGAMARETADYYRGVVSREDEEEISQTTIARSEVVERAETRLSTLEIEYAAKSATFGPDHPEMKSLRERIEATRQELKDAVETVVLQEVRSANPEHQSAAQQLIQAEATAIASRAREDATESVIRREMERLEDVPYLETDLARLQREANLAAQLFRELSQSHEQVRVRLAESTGPVEVFTLATPPPRPVRPRKLLNAVLGLMAAATIAVMLVVAVEVLSDVLRTEEHAARELGLPLLASIPRTGGLLQREPDEQEGAEPRAAEAYQTAAAHLLLDEAAEGRSSILVTAPEGGEHAATAAVGLAWAFARAGRRTLLIDGNLDGSRLHERLDVQPQPGLSDVLDGSQSLENALHQTRWEGLDLLPAGSSMDQAADLLQRSAGAELFEALGGRYDAVLINGCAWPSHDTAVLASRSDASVVSVRLGVTGRGPSRRLVEDLQRLGGDPVGFVAHG